MTTEQKKELLAFVRQYYEHKLLKQEKPVLEPDPGYDKDLGLFVTLHYQRELRGCIGYIQAYKPMRSALEEMAHAAAFEDNRFSPLDEAELEHIKIEISILSELMKLDKWQDIMIGTDGILLKQGTNQAVFLPQVAVEQNWDLETTLKHLCRKAGLRPNAYTDPQTSFEVFTAEVFSENELLD